MIPARAYAVALLAFALFAGCTTPPPPAKRIDLQFHCEPLQTSARISIIR